MRAVIAMAVDARPVVHNKWLTLKLAILKLGVVVTDSTVAIMIFAIQNVYALRHGPMAVVSDCFIHNVRL